MSFLIEYGNVVNQQTLMTHNYLLLTSFPKLDIINFTLTFICININSTINRSQIYFMQLEMGNLFEKPYNLFGVNTESVWLNFLVLNDEAF